jgi:hypothetical protein
MMKILTQKFLNSCLLITVPFVFFIFLFPSDNFAQKKITTIPLNAEVRSAYVDRVGELYVMTANADIRKFDINGKLLSLYKNSPVPTLFDPRDGSRLFAFSRNDRSIAYLSPSLEPNMVLKIDSAFVIDPWLACASGDHDLWILDAADESLKKISPRTSTMPVEVKLPNDPAIKFSNIAFMREYQGFLFLLDKEKGIQVFNGMGKWIKTITTPSIRYFNFLGEELYFPANGKLLFTNLFTGDQRQMSISNPFQIALATDERLFLIQEKSVDFFQFKP